MYLIILTCISKTTVFLHFEQPKCLIGKQAKNFRKRKNIETIEIRDVCHRAIGLEERLILTIKRRHEYAKGEKADTLLLHMAQALKSVIYQLQICKRKTT